MPSSTLFERIGQELQTPDGLERARPDIQDTFGHTLTLVVIDSSGFSRTTRNCGILQSLSCLYRMRSQVLPTLEQNGALSLRAHADNVYAEFENPGQALEALIKALQAVREARIELYDGEFLGLSCGIGHGDVLFGGPQEGFHGDEMNLASKLGEDLANKGEILMTHASHVLLDSSQKKQFTHKTSQLSGLDLTYYSMFPLGNPE